VLSGANLPALSVKSCARGSPTIPRHLRKSAGRTAPGLPQPGSRGRAAVARSRPAWARKEVVSCRTFALPSTSACTFHRHLHYGEAEQALIRIEKTATTQDPIDGVMGGVSKADIDLSKVALFSAWHHGGDQCADHAPGCTRTAVVTTHGFRDIEPARQQEDHWDTYKTVGQALRAAARPADRAGLHRCGRQGIETARCRRRARGRAHPQAPRRRRESRCVS